MTTLERVEKEISEFKDLTPGELTLETTFADLELDSLDTVDLVMACEEAFGVTIELDDSLKTVGDIVKLIDSLVEQQGR